MHVYKSFARVGIFKLLLAYPVETLKKVFQHILELELNLLYK
jgi:hypothetical protein